MDKKLEKPRFKVCFISLASRSLLTDKDWGYVGGAEVQQVELAKELKKRGHEIFFITYGESNSNFEKISGIEIIPAYDISRVSKLGFLSKAIYIWKRMKEVDADIYFYRSGSPGVAALFGLFFQKKVIRLISSDSDVTGKAIIRRNSVIDWVVDIGNWFDIKLSDAVVSQNKFQKKKLKRNYGVESIEIKNAFHISPEDKSESQHNYVLWVGKIREVKQPSLFLEIAKYFPEHKFLMIGGKAYNEPRLFYKIKKDSQRIININFVGFIPHSKIFGYYKRAILLVNTSKIEGFPNVFLEAWMHSTPVISLNIDPDGIISKYKLGYHSKSFDQMINDVKTLLKNPELRQIMGGNGRNYIKTNHDIKKAADQYENLIKNLLKNSFINKNKY